MPPIHCHYRATCLGPCSRLASHRSADRIRKGVRQGSSKDTDESESGAISSLPVRLPKIRCRVLQPVRWDKAALDRTLRCVGHQILDSRLAPPLTGAWSLPRCFSHPARLVHEWPRLKPEFELSTTGAGHRGGTPDHSNPRHHINFETTAFALRNSARSANIFRRAVLNFTRLVQAPLPCS